MRKVRLMKKNTCKDYADLTEQMFIENIGPSTKDIEFHVFHDHLLTLRRK